MVDASTASRARASQGIDAEGLRDDLRGALARRGAAAVGTPLQEIYARDFPVATPTQATTFWGAQIEVVLPELVSCEIHSYGVIEPPVTALLVELVRPGTVLFDVGAHLGYHSMLAAALGGEVHAFEPAKETAPILGRNAGHGVTVVDLGVWSEPGTLELHDFGRKHSAVNTFVSSRDEALREPCASYQVAVTSLDHYVKTTGAVPQIIKIDAEGAEPEALRGARETIASSKPVITIEVGDTTASRTSRAALELALDLGYSAYDLTDAGIRAHSLRDIYRYGNVLLLPDGVAPPVLSALPRR